MRTLPPINLRYWALIVSATTLGETAGDLISRSLDLGYGLGSVVLIGLFVVVLLAELRSKVQHRALYWAVIVLASTAGTTMSDFITRSLGLGYGWGTLLMLAMLGATFAAWQRVARAATTETAFATTTTETLYWAAILTSSTLGTAFGDFLADATPLGFGGGTLALAGILVLLALTERATKVSKDVLYWLAIVVTHPIGATMGDYLTKPEGFDLGNVLASGLLLLVFAAIGAIWREPALPQLRTREPLE